MSAYFVSFWSFAGQTPGMRLLELRVLSADGSAVGVWRATVRLVGLALAIVPLFTGFLPVLVDNRRRGVHDMLAGTVVLYAGRVLPPLRARAHASQQRGVPPPPDAHRSAPLPAGVPPMSIPRDANPIEEIAP